MAPLVHGFDPPERFVAGTVGPPGQRTFFLQAREGVRVVSIALEKQQVQVLAERIDDLLDELMGSEATQSLIPAVAPLDLDDADPLDQPIEEEFRAGTMTLSWDAADGAHRDRGLPVQRGRRGLRPNRWRRTSPSPSPRRCSWSGSRPAAPGPSSSAPGQVLGAGRPTCPFCGNPIDPDGHLCVRANGFRRRDP